MISTTNDISEKTVVELEFLGQTKFSTGFTFDGTQVGGLSGITYDPLNNVYYSISDDRSQINPARFYTLSIDLSDGALQDGDVTFQDVTTLLDENGEPFPTLSLDPEGIAFTQKNTLFISSEGDTSNLINPFIDQFSLQGQELQELPVPENFLPTADSTSGIRNNLAFESLTITPNGQYLFTATENALFQDGPAADLEKGSPSRIVKYNLLTGELEQEFVYYTDPVAAESVPPGGFVTNGLVELLAIDNNGTLLALERSFSVGVGNTIKLYQVQTQGALDVSNVDAFDGLEIDPPVEKRLLLDFADLGIPLDNIEGMAFGPKLADGRQSLLVVSDNNFSDTQFTQFLAFAVDLDTTPGVLPTVETPPVIDLDQPPDNNSPGDADDPAIYVNPTDPSLSLVIATLKDGGLAVYDLNGEVLQSILPGEPGDVRYNNVDLVYGFNLGGQSVDLAIASDRENDTLAIFQIDPATRQLTDITPEDITGSIFGIDDGEQTAYGLATYTSPISGKSYIFVSQRETGNVAQLELFDNGSGEVNAKYVRTLTLPIPEGGELADAQVEGMVADRELGYLYVGQENVGIWKFSADPAGGDTGVLIDSVSGSNLEADVEGLTIYYADDGKGYLLASSQGDNTFAVYSREGNNEYLNNFVIGESGSIDSVQESDGADVINVPLGSQFPSGLLVVQDGSNDPAVVAEDDGQLENVSRNFKFVPWENVTNAFPDALTIDTTSFDPRNPLNVVNGTSDTDNLNGTTGGDRINGFKGNDTITGLPGDDRFTGGGDRDTFIINRGDGIDTVTDFGGIGTGGNPSTATIAEVDTIKFQGQELTARNMLLTQNSSALEISFVDVDDTKVILENFQLENLDNLKNSTLGNILFDGQNGIQDSFDVFNADWQREQVLNRNSVTFLNDLDNDIKGFNRSNDVINGQSGNDTLDGLSGDDLLRGGAGSDLLLGGGGQDRLLGDDDNDTLFGQKDRDFLIGGSGDDLLNGGSSSDTLQGDAGQDTLIGGNGSDLFILRADQGTDTIKDFQSQQDRIGLAGGLSFGQLAIAQGSGSNANDTIISVLGQNLVILTGIQSSSLDSKVIWK